jgi:DNA polymerase III subunit delta
MSPSKGKKSEVAKPANIYIYWGEDDFTRDRAVQALRDRTLDPAWGSFNFDKIGPDAPEAVIQGLNQAMTPPFGSGQRLVWLVDTPLLQACSPELLAELERTVKAIPPETVLLLTSRKSPDGRLKSTKLLKEVAQEFQEFALIPPWQTDRLVKQVRQLAVEVGVKLTEEAAEYLAESVGNNMRQLYTELEKLRLYCGDRDRPIDAASASQLVVANTQNTLQLAAAIRQGDTGTALSLVADLVARNEVGVRIVSSLVAQFRTWLWVKLMVEGGERDERAIANAAEIGNPKRIYYFRQEVQSLRLTQLQQALPILLELEFNLKRGAEELSILQIKVIELCRVFS